MIDIETLDTAPDATILSIAAVAFDTYGNIAGKLHGYTEDCPSGNATKSMDTALWWMAQDEEARKLQAEAERNPLTHVLNELSVFFESFNGQDVNVWGNGAAFDNVILRRAYERNGLKAPWEYWQDRCYRTLSALFPDVKAPEFTGVKHDALADATNQAKHLWEILKKVR
jgi:exodeoxyribonuclease VIII